MIAQRLHHFRVGKLQKAWPLLHDDYADAQRGVHAGIFNANHAASDDDDSPGNYRHAQNLVAVDDVAAVDRHLRIRGRFRPGGHHQIFSFQFAEARAVFDPQVMSIRERSRAMEQLYVVAAQLVLQHRGFVFDHAVHAKIQIAHRDVFFGVVICAVKRLVVKTGKMQNRLAHRLAGNGSGVDADAADHGLLFHHGHGFPDFRGLNGGSLPTGAGADDYEIKRSHLRNPELLRRVPRVLRGRLLPHIQYRRLGASNPRAYRIRYRGGTCSPSSPRLQVDPSRIRGCAKVSQAHYAGMNALH